MTCNNPHPTADSRPCMPVATHPTPGRPYRLEIRLKHQASNKSVTRVSGSTNSSLPSRARQKHEKIGSSSSQEPYITVLCSCHRQNIAHTTAICHVHLRLGLACMSPAALLPLPSIMFQTCDSFGTAASFRHRSRYLAITWEETFCARVLCSNALPHRLSNNSAG
jgi:hypothetical protein